MEIEEKLRLLARSPYYQSLWRASKETGISLFENDKNFSGLQIQFIYWLEIYEMLYSKLAQHEDKYLTEKVIESIFRTDCYLIYRNKKNDAMWKKHRQDEQMAQVNARRKTVPEGTNTHFDVQLIKNYDGEKK